MKHPPKPSTGTQVLAGLVDRVTFYNADSGFCVLRVKARGQRDPITASTTKASPGTSVTGAPPSGVMVIWPSIRCTNS